MMMMMFTVLTETDLRRKMNMVKVMVLLNMMTTMMIIDKDANVDPMFL